MWELDHKAGWVLKSWWFQIVVLEKILESPLDSKEIQPVHPKGNQSWIFIGRTNVEVETPILWPRNAKNWIIWRPWCWERLKAGGEGDDRGWDGWMDSPTQWTWVWVDSGSWWWTGRPGVLQSMGSQRVRHDWMTELNWTEDRSRVSRKEHFLSCYHVARKTSGYCWHMSVSGLSPLSASVLLHLCLSFSISLSICVCMIYISFIHLPYTYISWINIWWLRM